MGKVELLNITKTMNGQNIADHVDLAIAERELFVILGPSGSGKSTLLRLISGLTKPDKGRIMLNDIDITDFPPGERNIGMIFQENYGLYPHMNVYDNIAFRLRNHHIDPRGIEMHVITAAHRLEIHPLLKRRVQTLSGGEKRRVALARVLARKADMYLFDEPLLHLDAHLQQQARQEILMVHRISNVPSIYATHDQEEAIIIADRIGIYIDGQFRQIGHPHELIYKPIDISVARFVGSPPMNIIPAYIERIESSESSRYRARTKSFQLVLPIAWNSALERNGQSKILLGIHPHHIMPAWKFPEDEHPDHIISATIVATERKGKMLALRLKTGEQEWLNAVSLEMPSLSVVTGTALSFGIASSHIRLFHAENGHALLPEEINT